ncbi:MAG: sigma-70 family RNA polymerase sigma factor [Aestuariivirga sp.]
MNGFSEPMEPDLAPLLARIAGGDRGAFGRLYDLTSNRLFAVVRRVLKRPELAEEALQEAFVRVWQKAALYDATRARPMAWLAAIARNQAIDLRRRSSERVGEEFEGSEGGLQGAVLPEADLALEMKRLRECLSRLPTDRQDMVLLAYYQGWSREELAAQFRRPVTTVKTLLRRSLITLRECLDGQA